MQRRELLEFIALLTGCAVVGAARAEPGAIPRPDATRFSARDIALLDEIAETILPRTDTPGAKDAGVGAFSARYACACYPPDELRVLQDGLVALEAQTQAACGVDFLAASVDARTTALLELQRAGKTPSGTPGAFTLLQQLTLLGFFTSEIGVTQVGRYRPVPGAYQGCVDYPPGASFWTR